MRLGAPVFGAINDPEAWVRAHADRGYRAAYAPPIDPHDREAIRDYAAAAEKADLVIAETGAWSNPLSPNAGERTAAIAKCKAMLDLAERLGARCCVNISGSHSEVWDGPHPDNLKRETFDMIVEVVREIIDEVAPTRTYYTLELMPFLFPDSAQSYLNLIRAINRPRFGVHMDFCNMISSVALYEKNKLMIEEAIRLLGPRMCSVHVKDVLMKPGMTLHIDEVVCGRGVLDHRTMLREFKRLDTDLPIMLEHLPTEAEYDEAATHLRACAVLEKAEI